MLSSLRQQLSDNAMKKEEIEQIDSKLDNFQIDMNTLTFNQKGQAPLNKEKDQIKELKSKIDQQEKTLVKLEGEYKLAKKEYEFMQKDYKQ